MGRILLVSHDDKFLELAKLSFEERFDSEVVCSPSVKDAIRQMNRRSDFDVIVFEYDSSTSGGLGLLKFKISQDLIMPFYFFTDDPNPEVPYSGNSFIGIFRRNQFEELCESLELILRQKLRQ